MKDTGNYPPSKVSKSHSHVPIHEHRTTCNSMTISQFYSLQPQLDTQRYSLTTCHISAPDHQFYLLSSGRPPLFSSEGFWHSTIYKRECLIIFHLFSNIFYNSILKHRMLSGNKPSLHTWTQAYNSVDYYVHYWICHIRHFPDIQWF